MDAVLEELLNLKTNRHFLRRFNAISKLESSEYLKDLRVSRVTIDTEEKKLEIAYRTNTSSEVYEQLDDILTNLLGVKVQDYRGGKFNGGKREYKQMEFKFNNQSYKLTLTLTVFED